MADNFAKINKGVSYKGQGTTPSNLADGDMWYDNSAGFQIRNLGSTKSLPGSGGGGGGVNFAGLSTTWALATQDDRDAETSVGNWATYADAAGSVPVDMTGGTATQLTFSRTTTSGEILDGAASFKVVKAAANAQGQGISLLCNVPVAYQGKVAQINIPYKVISGSIATGDIILAAYDVTNSALLTVTPNIVASTNSTISALVFIPAPASTPANLQIRIGFHFASTSTTAVTLAWDDVSFGPQTSVLGTIMTDWTAYTPTFTGFGTCTSIAAYYRRVGDTCEVQGRFTTGTPTAVEGRISLPSGLTISASKTTTNDYCGILYPNYSIIPFSNLLASTGNNYVMYDRVDGSNAGMVADNGSNGIGTSSLISFKFSVPIQGWSSIPENTVVTAPQDSMVRIDITNGWGSTNTVIRKYTTTTTNVGPDVTYTSSSTLGDSWTINSSGIYNMVGEDCLNAGGNIGISRNSTQLTTGITSITNTDKLAVITTGGGNFAQFKSTAYLNQGDVIRVHGEGGSTSSTNGFFIITKQSVAPLTLTPKSKSRIDTTNGWGSTNSNIRKYSTVTTTLGTGYTYTSSGSLGDSWTINLPGSWTITVMDVFSSTGNIGLSKNSTQLTTGISSITVTDRLAIVTYGSTGNFITFSSTDYFNVGDVIRVHGDGMSSSNTTGCVILVQNSN